MLLEQSLFITILVFSTKGGTKEWGNEYCVADSNAHRGIANINLGLIDWFVDNGEDAGAIGLLCK